MTRRQITARLLREFMRAVGKIVKQQATFYSTGGSTAILYGFREGTIDIDIAGDMDEIFSHIPDLKKQMNINIEMTKPTDFVPSLQGEKDRHLPIATFGKASFMHFDPYAQAFSKIVRGHRTDIIDAKGLVTAKLVDVQRLVDIVRALPDETFAKYPRLDRTAVQVAVESFARTFLG